MCDCHAKRLAMTYFLTVLAAFRIWRLNSEKFLRRLVSVSYTIFSSMRSTKRDLPQIIVINMLEVPIFLGGLDGQIVWRVLIPDIQKPAFGKDSFSNIKGKRLKYLNIEGKIAKIFKPFAREPEASRFR